MRKMKIWGTLIALLIVFLQIGSPAESIIIKDLEGLYAQGQFLMKQERYAEAVEAFAQADGYEQSRIYLNYCRGMLLLQEADILESKGFLGEMGDYLDKAGDYFNLLSGIEFEDSTGMYQYIRARKFEASGNTQEALNRYATLIGVRDSDERYIRLKEGKTVQAVSTPVIQHNGLCENLSVNNGLLR